MFGLLVILGQSDIVAFIYAGFVATAQRTAFGVNNLSTGDRCRVRGSVLKQASANARGCLGQELRSTKYVEQFID